MSYVVLARKYRPQVFSDVYAQEHVTNILLNAINNDRIAHAYLFTGPRGVGKTSMARIMAKSLNCSEGTSGNPCNSCSNCLEITNGTSSDVVEIDGASNTGVDDIRDLQRELLYTTNTSKYKIYIIDEVHMLSKNAFNALLKTLEEPPENVIFIFATTEPHKVIPTIISRCQRFDFKRIPVDAIVKNLMNISTQEGIKYEEEALYQIAKKADGGMRDALSLMDQVIAAGNELITEAIVREVFGILPFEVYEKILLAIKDGNSREVIVNLHKIIDLGSDIIEIVNGLLDYLRLSLLCKYGVDTGEISKAQFDMLQKIVQRFDEEDLLYMISILMKTKVDMKHGDHPAILFEITLIKLSKLQDLVDINAIPAVTTNQVNQQNVQPVTANQVNISQPNSYNSNDRQQSNPQNNQQNNNRNYTNNVPVVEHSVEEDSRQTISHTPPQPKEVAQPVIQNSPFTIDDVAKQWDRFIAQYTKQDSMIASMLKYATIQDVTAKTIKLTAKNKFNYGQINSKLQPISSTASTFFSRKLKVEISLDESEQEEDTRLELTTEVIEKESPELAKFIKDTNSKITSQLKVIKFD